MQLIKEGVISAQGRGGIFILFVLSTLTVTTGSSVYFYSEDKCVNCYE